MKKTLVCLLSLAIATFALFAGAGCSDSSRYAKEIDIVIEKCNKIDDPDLLEKLSTKQEVLDHLMSTATEMKRIDTSRCPQDFRIAYEHLVQAVEYMYTVYSGAPEGILDILFGGSEFSDKAKNALERLQKATGEVNESAARYGAHNRVD